MREMLSGRTIPAAFFIMIYTVPRSVRQSIFVRIQVASTRRAGLCPFQARHPAQPGAGDGRGGGHGR